MAERIYVRGIRGSMGGHPHRSRIVGASPTDPGHLACSRRHAYNGPVKRLALIRLSLAVTFAGCTGGGTLGAGLSPNPAAGSCAAAGLSCQANSDCCQGGCNAGVCCPSSGSGCAASCAAGENCLCGACCPWIGSYCTQGACCAGLDCRAVPPTGAL